MSRRNTENDNTTVIGNNRSCSNTMHVLLSHCINT